LQERAPVLRCTYIAYLVIEAFCVVRSKFYVPTLVLHLHHGI